MIDLSWQCSEFCFLEHGRRGVYKKKKVCAFSFGQSTSLFGVGRSLVSIEIGEVSLISLKKEQIRSCVSCYHRYYLQLKRPWKANILYTHIAYALVNLGPWPSVFSSQVKLVLILSTFLRDEMLSQPRPPPGSNPGSVAWQRKALTTAPLDFLEKNAFL